MICVRGGRSGKAGFPVVLLGAGNINPLGLAGLLFICGCRLCVAVLCVDCGLGRDKLVDIGNRWLVLAERLVFYMNVAPAETFPQLLPYNVHELQHIESDT